MNAPKTALERLLTSAAAAPARATRPLSHGFEGRVLAALRNGDTESELAAILPLFRRGLAFACGLTALVTTVCWLSLNRPAPNLAVEEFALSADAMNLALAR
jgi:hypothetical protein